MICFQWWCEFVWLFFFKPRNCVHFSAPFFEILIMNAIIIVEPCICTYFYSPVFVMLWIWKLVLLLTLVSIQNSIFLFLWRCLFQKKMFWMWMFVLLPNIRVSPFENAHADVYLYRTLLFPDFSPSEKEMIPSVCITKRNV